MKTATLALKSLAPYSQSRQHHTPRPDKESHDDYERRTWIEKCHADAQGNVFIPPMALKFCLQSAAKELGMKVSGRGKKTFSSAFKNGLMILDPIFIGKTKADLNPNWISANADGVRGSGKRVPRAFPTVADWTATAVVHIVNDSITEEVLRQHVIEAGRFIGLGQFRPENGGYFGRFELLTLAWKE